MSTRLPRAAILATAALAVTACASTPGARAPAGVPSPTATGRPDAAAAPAATHALTEADVDAYMRSLASAARARDVSRLADLLADDVEIALTSRMQGVERTTRFTKAEYVTMLDRGYLSMKDLEAYEYDIVEMKVAVDPDGRAATVESQVVETIRVEGQTRSTRSHETTRVERRGGRPVAVRVTATTSAG